MKNNLQTTRGIILILISSLVFGGYGVWSKLIGKDFGVFYPGWTRALIAVIILWPFLYFKKEIVRIKKEDWKWLIVFLISTSLTQAPLFYAFNHMGIGAASLLFFTAMLLTMYLVGFIFFKEKITLIKILSCILVLIGMYLIFSFSLAVFTLLAVAMAILNGVASGGETSFSKKLSGKYSPLYLAWISWLIITITNGVASVALGEIQFLPSFSVVWLYQLGYIITAIIGLWAVIEGLRYVESSIGGLLGLLEIVFTIIFGILIFKEALSIKTIIGGAIIILAAALPHLFSLRKKENY